MIVRGDDRLAMRVADAGMEGDADGHDRDFEDTARAMAGEDAVAAEARVEALVTIAVQRWRLDDALFWQRAMFRARLIRAERGGSWTGKEELRC